MKRNAMALFCCSIITLAIGGAGVAEAAAGAAGQNGGRGDWGGGHGGPLRLKRLDTDHDGAVTRAEFMTPRKGEFARLDANKDGVADQAEMSAPIEQRSEYRIKRLMKRLDANGDGKVTREEFQDGPRARFAARDLNSDGTIGADERPGRGGRSRGWFGFGSDKPERKGEDRTDGRPGMTLDSVLAETEAEFKRSDANADGALDSTELAAAETARRDFAIKRTMHRADKDKDGRVTEAEFMAGADKRFATLDLNNDGKIAADDLPPYQRSLWNKKKE